jgi:tetratricopeptide (TPR) repeat protein
MKRVLAALVLVAACGCTNRGHAELEGTLQSATLAMRRGELDKAGTLAEQGITLTRATPDSEWAWTFSLLRSEILLRKREVREAIERLKTPPPEAPAFDPLRARYEFLRALVQLIQGQKDGALATLERARQIAPDAHDVQLDIGVLDGQLRYQLDRRDEADARLNGVVQAAVAQGDRYHQALALLNLGMGRLTRNRYDEALPWFERILALSDLSELTVYADALNDAGICHSRLGQFDEAARTQERAVALHARGTRREYEQALGQLGNTYLQWGDVRTGLPYLRQALAVATGSSLEDDAAIWAGNLASAYVDLREWDEAERFNDDAKRLKSANPSSALVYNTLNAGQIAYGRGQLLQATRLFDAALASAKTDPSVLWSAHAGLATVAIAQKRPAVATRHFEAALEIIEKTRSDLLKTDYRLSFLTELISFYRAYVDALVDQGQIERALEVADSSRGRVLAERQGVASASASRASASAFRRRAGQSKMVFLSYWLAPARSYLWIVTPARTRLVRLPPAQEIAALVRDDRVAIDSVMADPIATRGGAGDRLFDLLVRPALSDISPGQSVLVVPDGALYALNLETLPVDGARRHYWIEDVEIQLAPSLAMLGARQSAPAPAASLLLIGNPTPRDPEFPALKYAGAEMTNVARHFGSGSVTSFQGDRAVPAAYREARPDQFSLVHFTAHATANVESPLDSAVILSGPDGAFKLYARDVAAKPLHAELVTVSACRSAGERTFSGEGLVGFAWAFLRGGARRVIAGLWDVDDRSTAELMDLLYGRLADGAPAGQALREAKLSILRKGGSTAQPYYWAPFELFTLSP